MAGIFALAAPISTKNTNVEILRKSVTFHPSVWGNHFLSYTSDVTEISAAEKEKLEKLKEKVKNLLAQAPEDSTLKLELIDAIQRLGVGYHFVKEIEESLRQIHETHISKDDDNVRVVATRFRLLRQQGIRAPCDVIEKFMDDEGNFKETLLKDVEGILSLYEASYYGVNGEEIMDKALDFSSSYLESLVEKMNPTTITTTTTATTTSLLRQLKEALDTPISKKSIRLGAKKFLSTYQEDESHNQDLLNFAKLDFNILQKMHQEEAYNITRWWKDLDFRKQLPFARDRVTEAYFWILGIYFEPYYRSARMFVTKVLAMAAIVDDFYDVYGSLDELRRFTQAIESWDTSAADELPTYMRICYEAFLCVYDDMEDEMAKQGQSYRLRYAKQEMIELVRTYMAEAEWCYSKKIPSMNEYMKVALISGGYSMVVTTFLVGVKGVSLTKQDFDWITNRPPVIQASEVLSRLMDDLAGHGKEQKVTAVGCYMKEHGCSQMEASRELSKRVEKAWKDLNDEWMEPRSASKEILACIVNLSRVLHIMYSTGEDGFTDSSTRTKEAIKSLLVDPMT